VVFNIRDIPNIPQGSYVSIFITLGYIKEATYQFSDIYLPGKWANSWVLQSIIQGV
jgi:hypothetical protein